MTVHWAVHNDIRYWKNPDMFQPERFLTDDGRVTSEPEAYLPFSYGKYMYYFFSFYALSLGNRYVHK